jgi:drug/metabolite transporter (DMT)-like permease
VWSSRSRSTRRGLSLRTRHPIPRELAGIALALVSAVAFGTLAIFGKLAYREGAEPLPLLAIRFAFASVLLAAYVLITRRRLFLPRRELVQLSALGALGYAGETVFYFSALQRATAAVVSLVFYSYPIWTVLIGFATKLEPFRKQLVIALALGTGGVVLIFSVPSGGLLGPLLALAAAITVAIFFLATQLVIGNVDPVSSAMWTAISATLALGIAAFAAGDSLPLDALPHAFALGLATAVAFATVYEAIVRIGSPRAAVATMLEPVTTIALAAMFLGERLTVRVLIGATLVIAALPLLALTRKAEPLTAADSL